MFWELLLAHVLADFVFQTKSVAKNKLVFTETLKHCLYLFTISIFVLFVVGYRDLYLLIPILIISLTHGIIDYLKAKIDARTNDKWNWVLFSIDQIIHVISIILIIIIFQPIYKEIYFVKIGSYFSHLNLVKSALFIVLITFGGCYFTTSVCKGLKPSEKGNESLNDAGKYIGILERLIIFVSILAGRYEIIGFLIAAKSIIRHQDKNNKAFAEYFLIGTFTSFLWAVTFTYLYLKL